MIIPNFQQDAARKRAALSLGSSNNLDQEYWPFKGLFCSLLVHGALVAGLVLLPLFFIPEPNRLTDARLLEHAVILNRTELEEMFHLPPLGPESPAKENVPEPEVKKPTVKPHRRDDGFSYPGPQHIISDFPKPTNQIMTVLQPDLVNAPTLHPPLLLPNIVRIAEAAPIADIKPLDPTLKPTVAQPGLQIEAPAREEPPQMAIPTGIPQMARVLDIETPERPIEPPREPDRHLDVEAPKPSSGANGAIGARNLLTLSPMPAITEPSAPIPPGEARGRFSISPDANPDSSRPVPSLAVNTADAADDKAKSDTSKKETSTASKESSTTSGKNPFPGITITGGPSDTGSHNGGGIRIGPDPRTQPPLQTSYGVTVLSTGGGGASLPDVGVFGNEQVYTAFLDMRRTTKDPAPNWTVEYALGKTLPPPSGINIIGGNHSGIVLPFPATKVQPAMPAELVRKYPRAVILVYGLINTDGRMEQLAVKESPDASLNEPVLKALRDWVFRPAQRDGQTVAAKVLFGIPVWAAQ
jgi:Gram-negative bacterial TonB protein C-terminal